MQPDYIRNLRKSRGLTQTEFWTRIGITQSAGSRYETNRRVPAPVNLLLTLVHDSKRNAWKMLSKLRNGG